MEINQKRNRRWAVQRILTAAWFTGLVVFFLVIACPISIGILRLFVAIAIPGLWLLTIILTRRVKWLAFTILALGLSAGIFALLPGKSIEPVRLQSEYLKQLKKYEGTPYLWGGENGFGIDCSGLVRRALINAHMWLTLTTGNPKALRTGLDLWWHDCSARAMRDQYRDYTFVLFSSPSINTIDNTQLRPSDIAITSDGVHVLAYLGNQQWIQAEPGIARVVTMSIPADNAWFTVPVKVMRWTCMREVSDESVQ